MTASPRRPHLLSSPFTGFTKVFLAIFWIAIPAMTTYELMGSGQEIELDLLLIGPVILVTFSAAVFPLKKVSIDDTHIYVSSLFRTRKYKLDAIEAIRETGVKWRFGMGSVILRIHADDKRSIKVRFMSSRFNKETVKIVEDAIDVARSRSDGQEPSTPCRKSS